MPRLLPSLLLLAAAPIVIPVPTVSAMQLMTPASGASAAGIHRPDGIVVLIGGMGGGTTGGMGGGMTGGGMTGGGMIGGGMTGGGMLGGGMGGSPPGYSGPPDRGGQIYGGDATSSGGSQPTQYYQCVTQQGHCSVTPAQGSLRHGASCTCLFGGAGKIK